MLVGLENILALSEMERWELNHQLFGARKNVPERARAAVEAWVKAHERQWKKEGVYLTPSSGGTIFSLATPWGVVRIADGWQRPEFSPSRPYFSVEM